jgi:hypothetical protein
VYAQTRNCVAWHRGTLKAILRADVSFDVSAAVRLMVLETVNEAADAEPTIGATKIDGVLVQATTNVRIAEGRYRLMCSPYRWPLFRAFQDRNTVTSITSNRINESGPTTQECRHSLADQSIGRRK